MTKSELYFRTTALLSYEITMELSKQFSYKNIAKLVIIAKKKQVDEKEGGPKELNVQEEDIYHNKSII